MAASGDGTGEGAGAPLVSVVIAAYKPGDGFQRVIDSLDAQTLPQDRFETIVVDDGSPDDTLERLRSLAATRPNMRVERIPNSGWPSRPRNIGTGLARGEYVLYMDHDDSLFPDALRRAAEYARSTRADLLSPKESKTSDAWWGMSSLKGGNVADAVADGGIDRLLPMVPHKLYRREFLREHGIQFPEGRRQLWEDIYFNVEAWRHAERVAVLADTPVYLWHSSATNNSKTYGPRTREFWDRLDDLFEFVDGTLEGPALADARRTTLLHQYSSRVLLRLSRNLSGATRGETDRAVARAQAIRKRYIPDDWDLHMGRQVRARAILLRSGRPDLLAALWAVDVDSAARVTATKVRWRDGMLDVSFEAQWLRRKGAPVGLIRVGDSLMRDLSAEVRAALPEDVMDMTDTATSFTVRVGLRDRIRSVTWQLPVTQETRWVDLDDGRVAPLLTGSTAVDPATAAFGRPIEKAVHDLVAGLSWDAADRAGAVRYSGIAAPAVLPEGTAVAYSSLKKALALDTSATLRNVIADGGGAVGAVQGTLKAMTMPLPRIAVFERTALPAKVRLAHPGEPEGETVLRGELVAEGDGARLDLAADGPIPKGKYAMTFQLEDGAFLGERPARVDDDTIALLPKPPAPGASPLRSAGAAAKRFLQNSRITAERVSRGVRRRMEERRKG